MAQGDQPIGEQDQDKDDLLDLSAEDLGDEEPAAPPSALAAPGIPPLPPAPVPQAEDVLDISLADLDDVPPAAPTMPVPGRPLSGPVTDLPAAGYGKPKGKQSVAQAVVTATLNTLPLAIAGALGGLLAWGILEPFTNDKAVPEHLGEVLRAMCLYGGLTGGCISLAIGAVEGITSADLQKTLRGAGLGLLIGLFGGALGGIFGQLVYGTLHGGSGLNPIVQIVVRSLGWGMVGAFLGLAPGILARAKKRMWNGVVGGLVGGLVGGFLFDPIAFVFGTGTVSRLVGQCALGAAAGAAIAVVEQIRKEAWLVITAGPLTGKQFILYNEATTIGRAHTCDIALVKETGAAPEHCRIVRHGAAFVLEDLSGGATLVDGRPAARQTLGSGALIHIGSTALAFYERAAGSEPAQG